jgi:hypothetical protein
VRTPMKLEDLRREAPQVVGELVAIARDLERHFRDMQVRAALDDMLTTPCGFQVWVWVWVDF